MGWCETPRDRGSHEPCDCCVRGRSGVTCPRGCPPRPVLDVAAARSQRAPRRRRGRDGHPRVWSDRLREDPGCRLVGLRSDLPATAGLAEPRPGRRGPGPGVEAPASSPAGGGRATDPTGAQKLCGGPGPDPRPRRAGRSTARPRTLDGGARRISHRHAGPARIGARDRARPRRWGPAPGRALPVGASTGRAPLPGRRRADPGRRHRARDGRRRDCGRAPTGERNR